MRIEEKGFVFLFIVLFALVILNLITGYFSSLFYAPPASSSWFAVISSSLILFYFILWGAIRLKNQFRGKILGAKTVSRIMFLRASRVIGLRIPSLKASTYVIISMIVGMVGNFLILYCLSLAGYGTLYRVASPSIESLLQSLIVPPIFEEFIFRGIYLGVFLKLFGKSYKYAVVALVMSSFTFGWIHPSLPLVKMIGGFLLGSIYLIGWRKNLIASSFAHCGANLIGSFFVLSG